MIKIILLLIIFFTLIVKLEASEIVLNKNNIIFTEKDLKNYMQLYQDFNKREISKGSALKNMYLMVSTIESQIKKNSNFEYLTDEIIKKDVEKFKSKYSENILKYFLRYQILMKDFMNNFVGTYDIEKLEDKIFQEIKLYKDDMCKKLYKDIAFKSMSFIEKELIFINHSKSVIKLSEDSYACLNEKNINEFSKIINSIIKENGNREFLKYVYRNIK